MPTEQQCYGQKVREFLELKKAKTIKRRNVLNRDKGNLVKTNTWTPLFVELTAEKDLTSNLKTVLIAFSISFKFEHGFD